MSTDTKDGIFPSKVEPVKIGPLVRNLKAEIVSAFQNEDRGAVIEAQVKINALKELVSECRKSFDTMFDMAHKGYSDTAYLNGIQRIVKLDPDHPRGRKATVKPDPADLV